MSYNTLADIYATPQVRFRRGNNHPTLGPYSETTPRALWWAKGKGLFLMGEVPLYSPLEGFYWSRSLRGLGTRWSHWLGIGAIGLVD